MALTEEQKKKAYEDYKKQAAAAIKDGAKTTDKIKSSIEQENSAELEKAKKKQTEKIKKAQEAKAKNETSERKESDIPGYSAKAVSSESADRNTKDSEKKKNVRNLATQVNFNQSRQKIATGTPTLQGDKYTAPNISFMTRYESAKDYLEGTGETAGDNVARGLWNRFRSVPGEAVEDLAYLINDFAPEYKPAQKVIEANTAGQVAALADKQLSEAKEETGDVGDFLIDTADAGTRMLSNAAFFGKGNIAASQAIGGGLAEYRGQREEGTGKAESVFRGAASGAGSYFLERLGGIGGKKSKSILTAVVPGTNTLDTKKVVPLLAQVVKDAADEGGEEFAESVLATGIDFIADAVFRDEITIDFDLTEALRSAGIGAILGAGFAGTNAATAKATDVYYRPETPVAPVAPVAPSVALTEPVVPQTENVAPTMQNEQEAPFANAKEQDYALDNVVRELDEKINNAYRSGDEETAKQLTFKKWDYYKNDAVREAQQEITENLLGGIKNSEIDTFVETLIEESISIDGSEIPVIIQNIVDTANQSGNANVTFEAVDNIFSRVAEKLHARMDGHFDEKYPSKTEENGLYLREDDVQEKLGYRNNLIPIEAQPVPETSVRAQNDAVETKNDVVGARRKAPDAQEEIQYISEDAQDYVREDEGYENGAHPNTVGSQQSQNKFYKALNDYGAQPLRKEQVAKGNYFEVPKKLSDTEAMSEDVGYMTGSELGDNDFMDDVIQHPEKYAHQINTDTASMQKAIDNIQKYGLDAAYGDFEGKIENGKMIEKDDITKAAMTALFYQEKAQTETDPQKKEEYRKRSLDIKTDITYAATKGGQLLQSIQMLQKLVGTNGISLKADGEYMAQRLCDKLNKQRNGKGKEIVLNKDLVDAAVKAAGTDAEGKAWDEVYKDLANQTSTGFWQRLNNYRYWCMLSNPRTHVRNVFSNISMAVVNAVKDVTKAPVEALYNAYVGAQNKRAKETDSKINQLIAQGKQAEADKLSGKAERLHRFDNAKSKTTAIYKKEDFSYAWNDFKEARKIYDTTGKYSDSASGFIREYKTNANSDPISTALSKKIEGNNKVSKTIKSILEHGAFGSIMDFNSWMLSDVEDGGFKQITYAHELAQRMKANGITAKAATRPENAAKMEQLRAEAFAEALYNTFNEDSKVAQILQKATKDSKVLHVGIEAMLPFKKVPVNIVKTGLEYSPLGLAKGIGETAKIMANPDKGNVNKALNDLAKGLTGAELIALGAFLRSIGKITNGLSDDDDEKNFQKLLGEQAFALKFNDGSSYSIEWLGSSVMPLFTGALAYDMFTGEIGDKLKIKNMDGETDWNKVAELSSGVFGLLSSVTNPMIEMSMLSNIEYALTSQYNDIGDFLVDTLGDYANQFVPQFVNAITKTTDNTKRNTYYVDKTDYIPDKFQKPVQMAMSKTPGLSKKLGAQVDAWGRVKTHSDRETQAGWAFDAFLSPGTYKKDKTTEADRMISQLVAKTGDTNLYPSGPSQKYVTVDGTNHPLSAKEYEQMAIEKGQTQYNLVSQLIPNATYKGLSSEEQAEAVSQAYSYAGAKSKEGLHGYELQTQWQKLESAKEQGLPTASYLAVKAGIAGLEPTDDNEGVVNSQKAGFIFESNGLSDEQKIVALEHLVGVDMDNYKEASKNPKEQIMLYQLISDKDTGKEEDIRAIRKNTGKDIYGAREMYYKATGDWANSVDEVIDNGTNRDKKVATLKKFNFSDKDIIKGYNAIIGVGSKKADIMDALTEAFGSKSKATTFYNVYKGLKGYT